MKPAKEYKGEILDKLLREMELDPWYVKLRRWFHLQKWLLICRLRFIWDLEYKHNIFRKKFVK